jgi:hypothetical protein
MPRSRGRRRLDEAVSSGRRVDRGLAQLGRGAAVRICPTCRRDGGSLRRSAGPYAPRMRWHARQLAEQTGRTFVVTGANSGIGLEAARVLVGRGADVVLAVRDTTKGEQAAGRLEGPGSTRVVELDLSDLDQVADCAEALLDRNDELSAWSATPASWAGRSC